MQSAFLFMWSYLSWHFFSFSEKRKRQTWGWFINSVLSFFFWMYVIELRKTASEGRLLFTSSQHSRASFGLPAPITLLPGCCPCWGGLQWELSVGESIKNLAVSAAGSIEWQASVCTFLKIPPCMGVAQGFWRAVLCSGCHLPGRSLFLRHDKIHSISSDKTRGKPHQYANFYDFWF